MGLFINVYVNYGAPYVNQWLRHIIPLFFIYFFCKKINNTAIIFFFYSLHIVQICIFFIMKKTENKQNKQSATHCYKICDQLKKKLNLKRGMFKAMFDHVTSKNLSPLCHTPVFHFYYISWGLRIFLVYENLFVTYSFIIWLI